MAKIGTLICDANILIDYLLDRGKILRLATKHCYDIYIPRQVLEEVRQLDDAAVKNLGINTISLSYIDKTTK